MRAAFVYGLVVPSNCAILLVSGIITCEKLYDSLFTSNEIKRV